MLDLIKNVFHPWVKKLLFTTSKWIGGLLLAALVSTMFIGRIVDSLVGPSTYFVYLVGDFDHKNFQDLREGFDQEQQKVNLKIANIDVRFQPLEAKENDAESISHNIANKNDTLLVIGHLTSTASATALPNYLNADPPIPVILATETNPELLPRGYRLNYAYAPVFRLSPTDNQQAQKAAGFMVDNGAKNIWVVEDAVTNQVYSRYLAQQFIRQVHEKSQIHEKRQIYEKRQALGKSQIHEKRQAYEMEPSKVLLWTTNLQLPSPDVVQALRIDWVFFAGRPTNCLILTRQVKEMWKNKPNKPRIMLGDSCANLDLLRQGGEDIKEAFLTHPMLASEFNKVGFRMRGRQAFQLAKQLIDDADYNFRERASKNGGIWYYVNWVFGRHQIADARNALRGSMEEAANSAQRFLLEEQRYTFNRDGTAQEAEFHVWKVETLSNEMEFADIGTD
jgi:hypothetical protein